MKLTVVVKPKSTQNRVEEKNGVFTVYTSAPPSDGKANDAVCRMLADHFDVSCSNISIVKGHASRKKIIEVNNF